MATLAALATFVRAGETSRKLLRSIVASSPNQLHFPQI